MKPKLSPQFRVVIVYLTVGSLWIYLSDRLIAALVDAPAALTAAQHVKGWAFIAVTAVLLFFLVRRDFEALHRAQEEAADSRGQAIAGWVQVSDLRHRETREHTERVARMTIALAKRAGISDESELRHIEQGAILHDIGKIGILDAALTKPGRLDEAEWSEMKRHPEIGYEILSRIRFLQPSLDIPHHHHERWDGSGYPDGLEGETIPLAARLFAIVDVWDALSHERIYKPAWPEGEVLRHLEEQAGCHFDPRLVRLFLEHYAEIKGSGEADLPGEKGYHIEEERHGSDASACPVDER